MSDEIQRAALLAGFTANHAKLLGGYLFRFAAIVAENEREACAKECEQIAESVTYQRNSQEAADRCADAIRARK